MGSFGLSVASLVAALFACNLSSGQIILEVPGYAVLNGTEELSSYTERPFFAFRSVFYAEKPTSEGRFLVSYSIITIHTYYRSSLITIYLSHHFQSNPFLWMKSSKQPQTIEVVLDCLRWAKKIAFR